MEQRRIGKNGLLVSAMGIGCMGMSMGYGPANDKQSMNTLERALDLGIDFIDTADMYGWGHNEELIGKVIRSRRNQVTLATKMGFVKNAGEAELNYYIDGSAKHVKEACHASLKRLGVETIDLYYLHRVDSNTPIEETVSAMAELVQQGKIRYIGLSEVKSETIKRAAKIHPIAAIQTEYSLWERYPEEEIIPTCEALGIGFVAYCPLGRGFLTGAVTDTTVLSSQDFRPLLPRFQGENFITNKKLLIAFKQIAEQKNCTMAQLALAWILAKNKNMIPIPGMKQKHYVEENIKAVNLKLTDEEINLINKLFPLNVAKGKKYPKEFDREA